LLFPEFVGSTYTLDSVPADCQRCVNLYLEVNESGNGKNRLPARMVYTPGSRLNETVGNGPIRGQWVTEKRDRYFVVSGGTLYEKYSDGTATASRGSLSASSGTVYMQDNGTQLMIVEPGVAGWIFTLATNTLAQITDADFPTPGHLTYQDGYFIVAKYNDNDVYISSLYDGTTWDALDFGTKEGKPDNVKAIISDHRELLVLGDNSGEVWFNSGDTDFPLTRRADVFLEHGIADLGTLQQFDNSVVFGHRSRDGACQIVRAVGGGTERISTHAIEQLIETWGGFGSCSSHTYQWKGHWFYVLNFTLGTIQYNAATKLWNERSYTPTDGTGETRIRANNHVYFGGKHLVGDWENGKIYELAADYYYDNGAPITRRRRAPHISNDNKRLKFNSFELSAEVGVGLDGATSTQGYDPQVMLRWSNDQGRTWSNEHWRSLGRIGAYGTRARWTRLGMARDRVYEVIITDPVKVNLLGAYMEVEALRN
jgi:hypothetical protein